MKIKELKTRLKELATFIRKQKFLYKECQRGSAKWEEYYALCKEGPKGDYRHLHIAYCLLRGTKYEQIENKVKEGNEPNWTTIEYIMKEYCDLDVLTDGDVAV